MLVVRTKVYSNAILCEAILLNLYFKCWYFQGTRKVVLGLSLFAEITNIGLLTINYVAMYLSLGFSQLGADPSFDTKHETRE